MRARQDKARQEESTTKKRTDREEGRKQEEGASLLQSVHFLQAVEEAEGGGVAGLEEVAAGVDGERPQNGVEAADLGEDVDEGAVLGDGGDVGELRDPQAQERGGVVVLAVVEEVGGVGRGGVLLDLEAVVADAEEVGGGGAGRVAAAVFQLLAEEDGLPLRGLERKLQIQIRIGRGHEKVHGDVVAVTKTRVERNDDVQAVVVKRRPTETKRRRRHLRRRGVDEERRVFRTLAGGALRPVAFGDFRKPRRRRRVVPEVRAPPRLRTHHRQLDENRRHLRAALRHERPVLDFLALQETQQRHGRVRREHGHVT
mmetsp:Transcript_20779/g.64193  ORF Transcript_20779/g.64193 Transcript_20779/m.64193 type:complete len:313 (-) Transcript_20779:64-1002(-)